jgi:hypothetical protein
MLSEYNCDILLYWVPSGNFWHSYWKLIYPLKMMIFHSYVNVYQRVYRVILPILLISWGLSHQYALRHVDWLGIVISSQLRAGFYSMQKHGSNLGKLPQTMEKCGFEWENQRISSVWIGHESHGWSFHCGINEAKKVKPSFSTIKHY